MIRISKEKVESHLSQLLGYKLTVYVCEGTEAEDFERARRSVYGSNISAFNSVESIATSLMTCSFKNYELFRYIDAVAQLKLEDVMNCMELILDPAHRAVSVITPLAEEE